VYFPASYYPPSYYPGSYYDSSSDTSLSVGEPVPPTLVAPLVLPPTLSGSPPAGSAISLSFDTVVYVPTTGSYLVTQNAQGTVTLVPFADRRTALAQFLKAGRYTVKSIQGSVVTLQPA